VCAEPATSPHAATCGRCLKSPPPFSRVQSFGLYAGALREAVHELKFNGARRLARPLGRLLAHLDLPLTDVIVPVPLSPRSLRERGFNQTLLVAHSLSRETGIPVERRVLAKPKDTPPQVGLPRAERLRNLRGAFRARGNLDGLTVLLLDDVVTTTATVRECTRVLLRAGAREVPVASIARGALNALRHGDRNAGARSRRGLPPVKPSFTDPHVWRGGM
jgi:ComF family protein